MVMFKVSRVTTSPIDGQKPGTSGLRKKVLDPSLDFFEIELWFLCVLTLRLLN